ncbi:AFR051Wp [Eremothecium gossypii ATCC 10895]|uniref:Centractin n=1 Tax=Eremothecium gossypii (strain ATCC 10895 / CBS 109.51 / FGSC 9923 / NRRL Y-1056) TaxID=284811 RepID=Q754M1_EREGS|nr:AFR051Wp [Eremothecium gossypii ATCC 10895]AAS53422.2 AFR051Wp [Eremothecium gossypii ATCC 10895]AEY97734.1 FAFR051Wp [Eremothecium gossypii FDAG1]
MEKRAPSALLHHAHQIPPRTVDPQRRMSSQETLYNQPVVLDNGSGIIKAGFSGEEKPKCFEYSLIGTTKYNKVMAGGLEGDTFIGNQAQELRGLLKLRYPLQHGIVTNWADMEQVWGYVFNKSLQLQNVEDHPILVTEAPLNPHKNREKMCELLFESFNVPALYVSVQAVLSLYASGRTTGCVVDCGDGCCHAVPVFDGFSVPSSIRRIDIAGRDITEFLQLLLRKTTGVSLLSSSEREIVRTIKEKACFVTKDPKLEEQNFPMNPSFSKFKLPDGKTIELGQERYRAPEILFQPELIGSEFESLPDMCYQSIGKVDLDLRSLLYSNILLSGGTSMLPGFGDRLLKELKSLSGSRTKIKIFAPPERKYSTWIGGSILSGLSTFKKLWVTKSEWEEFPDCIHSRFM